ncbi:MAG: DUF3466 family protein [Gemmatimonadaceae bacterium]
MPHALHRFAGFLVTMASLALAGACSDTTRPHAPQSAEPGKLPLRDVNGGLPAVTDLGTLSGMDGSAAYGLNHSGEVVGYSFNSNTGASKAFIWGQVLGMTELPAASGWGDAYAFAVNDLTYVAGVAVNASGSPHAALWLGALGIMSDLGTLPGGNLSIALGINNAGQVAGYSYVNSAGTQHAFLWKPTVVGTAIGTMTDLGVPSGYAQTVAQDINGTGWVAGYAINSSNVGRATVWIPSSNNGTTGSWTELPLASGWVHSYALGVNNSGTVVGYAVLANNTTRAVIWPRKNGSYRANDAKEIAGQGTNSAGIAYDINDDDDNLSSSLSNRQISGYLEKVLSGETSSKYRAVWWSPRNSGADVTNYDDASDLTSLSSTVAFGQAINDVSIAPAGQQLQVAGIITVNGVWRAALWK